ncbi:PKD domain-containing protein [Hyalangium versicolor]|uniref:PKD domain-containing protein n=1 Tax=Hyalangium versicolor TaxID=2861190 RepID=UPI001CCF2C8D|nr:PKD domain-containing protein [Hyalangium versicolor]
MSRRRKAGIAALGACVLVALIAWLWPGDTPPEAALPPPPALPGPKQAETSPPPAPQPAPPPEAAPAKVAEIPVDPAAPVVDEVTVEKTEVCEGEENLVTVRAHTPDGTDPFLHYVIGGRQGPRVPVRSWIADDGESPKLQVQVFGKDNVVTTVDVPAFTVKSCKPERMALIISNLRANTWGEFDFEVKLTENPAPGNASFVPFQPRSYEWSFGDGETATTDRPFVTHSFENRKQDALFSNMLVEVKVRGNADEPVLGRTSIQMLNPAFEDLATKGVVTLLVQLTPRFPEMGSDGVVRQRVRLFHMRDKPVFIHNAQVFKHLRNPTAPSPQQVEDPSALLGTTIIPPGRGIEFEAKLDTNKEPDVFSLEHSLEGKDSEGLPVRGTFSVLRPPSRPTKENSNPVMDPMLKAKIISARKILNRPYVTDEDLWALERQGKFADINARFQNEQGAARRDEPREPTKDPGPPPEGPTATPGAKDEPRPHTPPKPGSR